MDHRVENLNLHIVEITSQKQTLLDAQRKLQVQVSQTHNQEVLIAKMHQIKQLISKTLQL